MQSTGQTSTHAVSFVPMHGSQMIYGIALIVSQACLSDLAALFTPPTPVVGRYETCVAAEPIEKVIESGAAGAAAHYGTVVETDWLGAFGTAGRYDPARGARRCGGTAPRGGRGGGE